MWIQKTVTVSHLYIYFIPFYYWEAEKKFVIFKWSDLFQSGLQIFVPIANIQYYKTMRKTLKQ